MQAHTRRRFLGHTAVLGLIAATTRPWVKSHAEAKSSPTLSPIRLGGPAFTSPDDPESYIAAHRQLGYRAAYCPNLASGDADKIKALINAAAKHDVVIAEVGRWCNLLDSNSEQRKKNLANVTEGLAVAEAVNARCCVDIAGSFNKSSWFGPHEDNLGKDFFDACVENARNIIDAVKPSRTCFTYEMMGWALPDSPDAYLKLMKAVDRKKAFGVHLDPCNLVNSPEKFYRNTALLDECFDKLGPWIASCHAKDLSWEVKMNIHFREVIPGKGSIDYGTYLKRVAALPQDPPLMLEHLTSADEYKQGRDHIFKVGENEGIRFS